MKLNDIVKQVSQEVNIPEEVVLKVYKSFYEFLREKISELPLKTQMTEEEFNKLKTNFNIPSIGKLHCTYSKFIGIKKRLEYLKKIRDERKEN